MPSNEDLTRIALGTIEHATEERPERTMDRGTIFHLSSDGSGMTGEDRNFWSYSCWNCAHASQFVDDFSRSNNGFPNSAWICEECITEYSPDRSRSPENINDWDFVPQPLFFRTDQELVAIQKKNHCVYPRDFIRDDRIPYLAFELEVENTAEETENGEAVDNVSYLWNYAKSDGSLETGFEIVSHPFTYDYFRGPMLKEWEEVLRSLKSDGFDSYKTESCGMHVHISKRSFTNYHLYRFLRIWYFSRRFTLWLSKRSEENFDQWSGFNKNGPYPISKKAKEKYFPEKYETVNLAHPESVEIRIFRGTLHPDSFRRNIEAVFAAYKFSDPYTEDHVRTSQITPVGFAKFVKSHKKMFPQLFKHFWNDGRVVNEILRENGTGRGRF